MFQLFLDNPLLLLLCMCGFWPGLAWIGLGYYVGKHGLPFEVHWRGRGSGHDQL